MGKTDAGVRLGGVCEGGALGGVRARRGDEGSCPSHSLAGSPCEARLSPPCLLCPETLRLEGAGCQLTRDSGRGTVPSLGSSFQDQRRNLGPHRPLPGLRPYFLMPLCHPSRMDHFRGTAHPPLKVRTSSSFTHARLHSFMRAFALWLGKNPSEPSGTRQRDQEKLGTHPSGVASV